MPTDTAVILAGGFGKRLMPLTLDKPKPMLEVGGKPILDWLLKWLAGYDVKRAILAVGYMKEKIIDHIKDGSEHGIKVVYSEEDKPLGTGGAIKKASKLVDSEYFFVVNGDVITNLNPRALEERIGDAYACIALVKMRSPYGMVEIDEKGAVTSFLEKPLLNHYINAGVLLISKKTSELLPDEGPMETTTLPLLARERKLAGVKFDSYWRSVDSIKDLEEVNAEIGNVFA
ncbi:MAG: nucleotidyltransferase family protein [Candidatus Micrarchaeaceae archaeon]